MNTELDIEIEDLGVASIETKGPPGLSSEQAGFHKQTGISDAD